MKLSLINLRWLAFLNGFCICESGKYRQNQKPYQQSSRLTLMRQIALFYLTYIFSPWGNIFSSAIKLGYLIWYIHKLSFAFSGNRGTHLEFQRRDPIAFDFCYVNLSNEGTRWIQGCVTLQSIEYRKFIWNVAKHYYLSPCGDHALMLL